MSNWFYLTDGQPTGPIEPAALKQLATSGRLKPTDKVRREDLAEWYDAKQVKGLFAPARTSDSPSRPTTATITPEPAAHADVSPPDKTEYATRGAAGATSSNGKSDTANADGKALGTASEFTKRVWTGMKCAAKLASKQAALKAIQLTELYKADLTTGTKAYANSIGRQQFADLYRHLEELTKEIETKRVAEPADRDETIVNRTKRLARDSMKRVDVEILVKKRKRLLAQLGLALRDAPVDVLTPVLMNEIAYSQQIARNAAVLEREIADLSAAQPKWLRPKRLIMIAAVCCLLLAVFSLSKQMKTATGNHVDLGRTVADQVKDSVADNALRRILQVMRDRAIVGNKSDLELARDVDRAAYPKAVYQTALYRPRQFRRICDNAALALNRKLAAGQYSTDLLKTARLMDCLQI